MKSLRTRDVVSLGKTPELQYLCYISIPRSDQCFWPSLGVAVSLASAELQCEVPELQTNPRYMDCIVESSDLRRSQVFWGRDPLPSPRNLRRYEHFAWIAWPERIRLQDRQ